MCYFVDIATPLTLSEVRSMLPVGLSAQPVSAVETAALRRLLPNALTVATLLAGACSCDLVRARHADPREDERHLRTRYFAMKLARDRIIVELERHRRRPAAAATPDWGMTALRAFAGEHARNAGPTMYRLWFGPAGGAPSLSGARRVTRTVAEMRSRPSGWLEENATVLLIR